MGSDSAPKLSRGPFCAMVRAEGECGNDNLPGAPEGMRHRSDPPVLQHTLRKAAGVAGREGAGRLTGGV
eukprot:88127-Alexandrium_andersonii.AAC.1